ncbi:MAG: subclass B3 metallo-beta-lactamase [Acidobacteriota bacterium]|nr:subclass B3 metallo-beta-lactamase [Acidobacteriota bacterium]
MNRFAIGALALVAGSIALLGGSVPAPGSQSDPDARAWNQPVKPFHIIGNIYYVGAKEISSFLIVTPRGDVVLNAGYVQTAPQIEANIRSLGFHVADVKILLNSHAHLDHAGGLAELKRVTGARFYASAADAPLLESGGRGDYAFGDKYTFPPIKPDRLLHDGDTVSLGGTTLTARLTPGHTKGCTTWTMNVQADGKQYPVVFACSTSVLQGVRLVNNPLYPGIARDYERAFRVLRSLPCGVFLSDHGWMFHLDAKRQALASGAKPNPFIDPAGYRAYIEKSEAAFLKDLHQQEKEEAGQKPDHPSR